MKKSKIDEMSSSTIVSFLEFKEYNSLGQLPTNTQFADFVAQQLAMKSYLPYLWPAMQADDALKTDSSLESIYAAHAQQAKL